MLHGQPQRRVMLSASGVPLVQPPSLTSHARWLGWTHRRGERVMPSLCGAGHLACRAMLGGSEGSPERALLSPSGVPLVQSPLLVEPCSVPWTGSPIKREIHALCLWRCSPCSSSHARGLGRARQREPCSLHLVFRWCSPPCLSSHARWLGRAHR
jgi:hypothetical protein